VAGGHKQVKGINYSKPSRQLLKLLSVRVVLANAAEQDWEIHQIDVKSAYLPSPAKGDHIYEAAAWSFEARQEGKVCCLLKGLYRLKTGQTWVVPRAHQSFGGRTRF